jgi:hypothetical protein
MATRWGLIMKIDYWLPGDQVFVTGGEKFGAAPDGRTINLGPVGNDTLSQTPVQPAALPAPAHQDTPVICDNQSKSCVLCGGQVPGKRSDRRFCSVRCRKIASRGKQLEMAGLK